MTRHVPPQLPLRKRSVRASPRLTFDWEKFSEINRELPPLFKQHWREIALDQDIIPLAPDWDTYFNLELNGALHILTARRADDRLVGYCFNFVGPHQHYVETRYAHTEMFWLHPDFRKGFLGIKMLLENMRGLKAREVVVHSVNFKLHFMDGRVGRLFQRMGYSATDIVMRKVL